MLIALDWTLGLHVSAQSRLFMFHSYRFSAKALNLAGSIPTVVTAGM